MITFQQTINNKYLKVNKIILIAIVHFMFAQVYKQYKHVN
jgi:hypothetical protein